MEDAEESGGESERDQKISTQKQYEEVIQQLI